MIIGDVNLENGTRRTDNYRASALVPWLLTARLRESYGKKDNQVYFLYHIMPYAGHFMLTLLLLSKQYVHFTMAFV